MRHVLDLHGVDPAWHLDDGRAAKVLGEHDAVDGGGHEHELERGPALQDALEHAQQKVRGHVALVDLGTRRHAVRLTA